MEWWKKTVVYECYPKSFLDTKGNGTGTIQGVTEKLDYLKTLGVGALWLTPIFRSPMIDNGYDVASYTEIDPAYGTMDDMDQLFQEAEKKDIRIVLDLVFNHTSDQNPWFQESRKSKDNKYSDWYIWRDPKENGEAPTNWRSIFGGSSWTYCKERGQYYLHTFASQQPDLNWANPDVRKALYDAANFWVDKGAGGFRLDAIPYIKKPDVFKDGKPDGEDGMVSVHDMTVNTPGILDYLHEFKKNVRDGHDIFTVGEANGVGADELDQWVGKNGVFDMLFEFSHVNLEFKGVETWCHADPWTISDLKTALRNSQNATRNNGWYPIFFENHDKPRCVDHYFSKHANKENAAKAIGMILYTLRGTPFLFQGQELGMENVDWNDIQMYNDISSHGQYEFARSEGLTNEAAMECVKKFSRDSARTPMQWDDSENAGFTTGRPWLPVHADYAQQNVRFESKDAHSVLSWYRSLAEIRNEYSVLKDGTFAEVLKDDPNIFAYKRENDSLNVLVLVNLSESECTYEPDIEDGFSKVTGSEASHIPGVLKPLEAILLARERIIIH